MLPADHTPDAPCTCASCEELAVRLDGGRTYVYDEYALDCDYLVELEEAAKALLEKEQDLIIKKRWTR